jgi:signal peptidase
MASKKKIRTGKEGEKMMRRMLNILYTLVFAAGIGGLVLFLLPRIFQLVPQIVLSGSMEPEIGTGSLAYTTSMILPEEVREQDIIAYRMGREQAVLHRVIRIDEDGQCFLTKGDANQEADIGEVSYSRYLGKFVFSIPYLGYAAACLQNRICQAGVAAVCVFLLVTEQFCRRSKRRKMKKERMTV